MRAFYYMKKYIGRNWKLWVCGIFLPAFFSTATNIYFAGRLQNYVMMLTQPRTSFPDIVKMLFLSLPVLLLLSWIDNAGLCVFSLFLASTENELRYDFYKSLVRAPLKNLQQFSQGQLLTRYNTDIEQSAQIVSYDIFGVIYPLIVGTGYTAAVLLADVRIGFLMLLLGVIVILLNFLFMRRIKRVRLEILQAKENCTSNYNDAIKGKMSIRQYSAQTRMCDKIEAAAQRLYQKECGAVRLETWKVLTSDAAANVCIYLLTPLACVMASRGYLSVAVVLFIHQLCRCFIMYTQNFAVAFIRYSEHSLSLNRIYSVMSLKSELTERDDNSCEKIPQNFDVTFENVCAAYGSHQILKNISFTVSPGECIGIVGESGSGKSTLIKALMQLIDYQGEIRIGGQNCKNISLNLLRSCIAYSPEHNDIFPTTVFDNIRYGDFNATEDEMKHAAELAGIAASEEAFYRRNIGENGDRLSGGQRQRVSLARALLKKAPIYIFDEPTAALDADSESGILSTISMLKQQGKCILLITHKASTLHIADRIFRIEDGKMYPV